MPKLTEQGKVLSNKEIAKGIFDLRLYAPAISKQARAGQFVNVLCGGDAYLRRPISICDATEEELRLIYQVKGVGTSELSTKKEGDELNILGPLGNWFHGDKENALVIGGGIGTYPLFKLCKTLDNPQVVLGFRTKELVTLEEEFSAISSDVTIMTDDGTYGTKGFVTDQMKKIIAEHSIKTVYACGPKPMLRAVTELGKQLGVRVQVSLEERMGCGIGACLVCACKIKKKKGDGWEYAHVCKNGPIFWGDEVIFE